MVEISVWVRGPDSQQVDAASAHFIEAFIAAGCEVTTRQPGEIEILITNVPVQLALDDATKLRGILRALEEHSPELAREGLEIIEAAILLR